MTELDRIFRHFRARDIINQEAEKGEREEWLLLDPTDDWIGSNFKDGNYRNNRRLLFFLPATAPKPWSIAAGNDPNPFTDEQQRADDARTARNEKARERRTAGGTATGAAKKGAKKAAKKAKKAVKKAAKKGAKKATKKTSRKAAKKKTAKKATKKRATKKTAKRKTAAKGGKKTTAKKKKAAKRR